MDNKQETENQDQKEKNVHDQESTQEESNDQSTSSNDTTQGTAKQWLEDNLRIIVSVVIVILIAGGIYSYSKRGENPQSNDAVQTSEQSQSATPADNGASTNENATKTADQTKNQGETQQQPQNQAQPQNQNTSAKQNTPKAASSVSTSQETANSFVETAAKGDSETKLARRALADYLEKNPDSTLTAEHKVYIEDYLRKNVPSQRISIGTSVEFSKGLLQQAVAASKNLNSRQLQNLHKYAVAAPSLS